MNLSTFAAAMLSGPVLVLVAVIFLFGASGCGDVRNMNPLSPSTTSISSGGAHESLVNILDRPPVDPVD